MPNLRQAWWAARTMIVAPFYGSLHTPSYIGPTTFVMGRRRIFIGKKVRIFPGLRAEVHGSGKIVIEDDVAIGQSFHVTAMGNLRIGAGTLISGFAMVTDIDHEYTDVSRSVHEQPMIHSHTELGRNCFIGMGARIQAGTVLGDGCVVGANAVVRGEFAANSVIVGVPARAIKVFDATDGTWRRVAS